MDTKNIKDSKILAAPAKTTTTATTTTTTTTTTTSPSPNTGKTTTSWLPASMHATVFQGVGMMPKFSVVPTPSLHNNTDVILRVHKTTICGTDLHILGGNVPKATPGRILGHEGIGYVVEAGEAVKNFKVGDRVLISCITACGKCTACGKGQRAFCDDGGWLLGHTIDGMQAQFARIPHADSSAFALPAEVPHGSALEDPYVMLSDIIPTSFEIGLRAGRYPKAGSMAIVGCGPVGLAALLCAAQPGSEDWTIFAIDLNSHRLAVAASMGATHCLSNAQGGAVQLVMDATGGKGVDFVIECIGLPVGAEICQDIVAVGGQICILGVHGTPGVLKLDKIWDRNISIHTGMVHGHSIPNFITRVRAGKLDAGKLISHHFSLGQMEAAYEHFKHAEKHSALKVLITNDL